MRNVFVLLCGLVPGIALAQNAPPVADAGPDQTVFRNQLTLLQGGATDVDGDIIAEWAWVVDAAPAGSNPYVSEPDTPDPLFRGDVAGDYVLSLIASDGLAWSEPDFVSIHVHELLPPRAVIQADVTSGVAPLHVQLDGSASFVDPFAEPLAYNWDFGDFTIPSTAVAPVHTFASPGDYHVVLKVIDALGQADEDFIDITVVALDGPPIVRPTVTPSTGTAPLIVQFRANATDPDGDPLTYLWDFGDPSSPDNASTLADPGHAYEAPGVYTAWLEVADGRHEVTASLVVVVSATQALSTRKAWVITRSLGREPKGAVSYWADISLPTPAADDVISLSFDGVKLFTAPFSRFARGRQHEVYVLTKRALLVRLNLDENRIYVFDGKANLEKLDNADGVDLELTWGAGVAVDQFVMTQVAGAVWRYDRGWAR